VERSISIAHRQQRRDTLRARSEALTSARSEPSSYDCVIADLRIATGVAMLTSGRLAELATISTERAPSELARSLGK
jgi:hypothetical protein